MGIYTCAIVGVHSHCTKERWTTILSMPLSLEMVVQLTLSTLTRYSWS